MADKFPWLAAESGYYRTGAPNPHIDLDGIAVNFGSSYPSRTFAEAAADSGVDFDNGDTCQVLIVDTTSNATWAIYQAATWTDLTTDIIDLSAAILLASEGTLSAGTSVNVWANFPYGLTTFTEIVTPDQGELTISSGAITVTGGYHTVDTESDAASDDLDTISGGTDGMYLILQPENGARTVVVKNGTGNIDIGADVNLDDATDAILLIYSGASSSWVLPGGVSAPPSDGNYYAYKDGDWVNITNKIINP